MLNREEKLKRIDDRNRKITWVLLLIAIVFMFVVGR